MFTREWYMRVYPRRWIHPFASQINKQRYNPRVRMYAWEIRYPNPDHV